METVNCVICGEDDTNIVFQTTDRRIDIPDIYTIVRCNRCGLVFQNPRPGDFEMGKHYPETYDLHQDIKTWRPSQQNLIRKQLIYTTANLYYRTPNAVQFSNYLNHDQYLYKLAKILFKPLQSRLGPLPSYQPPGRVLEIGCGIGAYLDILKDLGWDTYGVETNQKASHIARLKGHQVISDFLEDALWPDQYFQAACLWHTLEHLHQPIESLINIHRLLTDGAELLIEVPNWESLSLSIFSINWFGLELPRHLYFFTKQTLEKSLVMAGFEIVEAQTLPSKYVIQKSQVYLQDSKNRNWAIKSHQFSWPSVFHWRLIYWAEKLTKYGDLLRVRARRI